MEQAGQCVLMSWALDTYEYIFIWQKIWAGHGPVWFQQSSTGWGDSVCGHQVPCHRLTGALVRCNHPGGPKALNK
jgi:hypothetical protein